MTATFCPPWAKGAMGNYRRMYKDAYGQETVLTDQDIWDIYNYVFDDTDKKKEDQERVVEMRRRERRD